MNHKAELRETSEVLLKHSMWDGSHSWADADSSVNKSLTVLINCGLVHQMNGRMIGVQGPDESPVYELVYLWTDLGKQFYRALVSA